MAFTAWAVIVADETVTGSWDGYAGSGASSNS